MLNKFRPLQHPILFSGVCYNPHMTEKLCPSCRALGYCELAQEQHLESTIYAAQKSNLESYKDITGGSLPDSVKQRLATVEKEHEKFVKNLVTAAKQAGCTQTDTFTT